MNASVVTADYLSRTAYEIEQALRTSVPQEWPVPAKLREAMLYSLEAGGKRLRPILVLAAAEAVRGEGSTYEAAMPVACAIEMIHTYSLIHDDLPAMDNDDYRRGKPTNHKVFGEAMAILAGDGLLSHAFYAVSQTASLGVPSEVALAIVSDLAKLSGASGMVGGQAADILGEQGVTSLTELEYIHLHKTSDLIVFSITSGARIGGATPEQLAALEEFARKLGLAFQVRDDILDLVGDETKLGKPVQSDVQQQKVTYPFIIGMEQSLELVKRLTKESKEALRQANLSMPEKLLSIADYLMNRDH
ncbi:polyprenyl synthetase family protein [Paenibacillus nasutitermitis]|uniref:Farnesyl diphosphate synthase n=1 Tax=Paenibacillus nasutitermitis TaxID=1652958 RepID=A0A916Z023_9BACL|nr:farnesyl diphosphate synthase [Paenibacillus nasutitermitis]GGD70044.1 farnesyl-diphosphate synthase [Paenibacillus nasutitermitis]